MNCPKCNKVMIIRYIMDPDGTFRIVWHCRDCKMDTFAAKRRC